MTADVFILDAVRTPVGRLGGALAGVRPDDLAATVVKAIVERSPALDPATIDEVYLGDANGAGEDNRNVARMAVLLAGLPVTVPGAAVKRLCGSGLEAVSAASRTIAVGAQSLACLREWPELDPAIVNPLGGAIAIGHPLGASGARILTTLVHHLHRTGGRYGLAAMCIGVGQGIATVIENLT